MTDYLDRPGLPRLAYAATAASSEGAGLPTVIFLGGFRSDMTGTKATFLEQQCRARGQGYIRFDYSGHGASSGDFSKLNLSAWKNDALAILDKLTKGSVIMVGSSMGGWIALLIALESSEKVAGLVGIAAAADFTRDMQKALSDEQKQQLQSEGFVDIPSEYSPEPYRVSKDLLDDGDRHSILDGDNVMTIPVRLIQGMKDSDVPWQTAFRIRNAISGDVEVILIESGDHRLSRPEDLALIDRQVLKLSGLIKE
jgi:pimeloyl-ACP methyl ester carboxylesterase